MEDCSSIDPWAFRSSFPESCWITDAFAARDNEVLTRALQISLSDDSSASASFSARLPSPDSSSSLFSQIVKPEPSAAFDPPPLKRARDAVIACSPSGGKITKRKSRASKRSPTTYITADPANFRQMVQQVTGVQIAGGMGMGMGMEMEMEMRMTMTSSSSSEPVVLKPEPHRAGPGRAALQHSCLMPTLDTSSAFLLDRAMGAGPGGMGSIGPVAAEAQQGFDFEGLASFPTLESWSVM